MALNYTTGNPTGKASAVPAGVYRLRVVAAWEDTSKGGNDMIVIKHRVIMDGGKEGPAVVDYLVANATTAWKIDQFLTACEQHPGEGVELDLDPDQMIGWECEAQLSVDSYNGKTSNKVANYVLPSF